MLVLFNLLMKILECMSLLLFSTLVLSAIVFIKFICFGINLCTVSLFLMQVRLRSQCDPKITRLSALPRFADIQQSAAVNHGHVKCMGHGCLESGAGILVDDDDEVARTVGRVNSRRAEWESSKINFTQISAFSITQNGNGKKRMENVHNQKIATLFPWLLPLCSFHAFCIIKVSFAVLA